MSLKPSSKLQSASRAVDSDTVSSAEWKVLEAGSLLAQFESYGFIWLNKDLTVEDTFGPLVGFVELGKPVTDSILAFVGLEQEIADLNKDTTRVLELPAVTVVAHEHARTKLNFTLFWNAGRDCPMVVAYKNAAQTGLELELSKQIRARLMAEAEVTATSKELARANSDLESFAAIISHDLKHPLRHMRQLVGSALDKSADKENASVGVMLQAIDAQAARMSRMLGALLDYSALGRKYEAIESFDSGALVREVIASLPESAHRIIVVGEWPVIATLRAPLDLVLRNLICNALQHHDRAQGEIIVRCDDLPQQLVFTISDDGPGIAAEHHEAIFLPFRTLKGADDGCSTGMGLAAVKKVVVGLGGSIELNSCAPANRGTTFRVYWPKALLD